jgi:hypothetical protein
VTKSIRFYSQMPPLFVCGELLGHACRGSAAIGAVLDELRLLRGEMREMISAFKGEKAMKHADVIN